MSTDDRINKHWSPEPVVPKVIEPEIEPEIVKKIPFRERAKKWLIS